MQLSGLGTLWHNNTVIGLQKPVMTGCPHILEAAEVGISGSAYFEHITQAYLQLQPMADTEVHNHGLNETTSPPRDNSFIIFTCLVKRWRDGASSATLRPAQFTQ